MRVVEHYTDLPVLGLLRRHDELGIDERHLGLMPSNEADDAETWIERIRARIADQVDLERLLAIAERATCPQPDAEPTAALQPAPTGDLVRIGIARDAAFGFYYPDDLRALAAGGAELVPFSPLTDQSLPDVDALFIGGGFPEYRMAELAANRLMRQAIREFVAENRPLYAECGGLMYLCAGLSWNGERCEMVGALDAEVEMRDRPQGRGYVRLSETEDFPWPRLDAAPLGEIAAHEFHHSAIIEPDPNWRYGYRVRRGTGIDGAHDGIVRGNLFCCYSHLRAVGGNRWTDRFLAQIRRTR